MSELSSAQRDIEQLREALAEALSLAIECHAYVPSNHSEKWEYGPRIHAIEEQFPDWRTWEREMR